MRPVVRALLEAYAAGVHQPQSGSEALAAAGLVYGCTGERLPRATSWLAMRAALALAAQLQPSGQASQRLCAWEGPPLDVPPLGCPWTLCSAS